MSQEADKLRADIATAEKRLAEFEAQACRLPAQQRGQVEHQIERAKDGLRDMRIKLASLAARPNACPVCDETTPPGWLVCEACSREVPARMHNEWQCARCHAHAARENKKAPSIIAQTEATERATAAVIIAHLKQHGSAL